MYKRFFFYPLLLVALSTCVHFWITQPLFWEKIPYRLQAYQFAFSQVECDQASPPELSDFLKYHSLPNFALHGQVVYLDQQGQRFSCNVSPQGSEGVSYRLASMTKAITAQGVLQLAEEGALDLNAHLLDFFPEVDSNSLYDQKLKQVTVAQLLNHSSGFGGPFGSDNLVKQGETPWCPYDFKKLESVRLAGRPGTNHVYSNVAYCLLGEIIARVTHSPYRQFVSDHYLRGTGLDFVDGGYLPEEPVYDFSNEFRFKRNYVEWLDFQALSSSAGLIGRPDEFAQMVWNKFHTDAPKLLSGPLVPGCGKGEISHCYSWNFELELDSQGRVLAGVQQGYMPGVSSMLAITADGQVLVWVAAGAAIESRYKDDLKKAVVEFLDSRKDPELVLPKAT